ncbi:recombinase family protein [Peribacillus saganii]|uniref:Recombinase family protein n=1 Tax=Peribacillus saganii TaxID=2303992 RepID=A0A372LV48_9BACI|nr:recombinase family protein [Peribacillus saganii]RFU71444.1 recombinase family protein [Peribacillus saganii]
MKNTVIYARQSLDKDKQKNSTNVQKTVCVEYAHHNDWIVHKFYNEGEKSARINSIEERPVISKLMYDAEQGEISRLIVYKRDRLARNVQQYLQIIRRLLDAKVEIHFAADNEPPLQTGPTGEFVEILLAGLAQQEGENIHRRQMQTRVYLAKNGDWCGGSPPYGYTSSEGTIKIVREKAEVVKIIFQEFIACWSEEKNITEIIKAMKEHPELKEVNFGKERILKIISQPLYKGVLIQRLQGVDYQAPNIKTELRIWDDDEIWNEANRRLKITCPDMEWLEVKEPYQALLEQKIKCGMCQQKLNDMKILKRQKVYYKCPDCTNRVPIVEFDQLVIDAILNHLKKMAQSHVEEVKKVLQNRFLHLPSKKKKQLEDGKLKLEQDLKKKMKQLTTDSSAIHSIQNLVREYKDKFAEHESLLNQCYHLEQAIQNITHFENLDKLTFEHFSYDDKLGILNLLEWVVCGESTVYLRYNDKKEKGDKDGRENEST